MAQTPEEKEAAAAAKAAEAEAKKAEKEAAAAAKAARASVTVTWRGGSREYTRALHGEDFEALAAEFAEKKKGTIV
jgi:hypothetical protein